jgi:hypothetical protein
LAAAANFSNRVLIVAIIAMAWWLAVAVAVAMAVTMAVAM